MPTGWRSACLLKGSNVEGICVELPALIGQKESMNFSSWHLDSLLSCLSEVYIHQCLWSHPGSRFALKGAACCS